MKIHFGIGAAKIFYGLGLNNGLRKENIILQKHNTIYLNPNRKMEGNLQFLFQNSTIIALNRKKSAK